MTPTPTPTEEKTHEPPNQRRNVRDSDMGRFFESSFGSLFSRRGNRASSGYLLRWRALVLVPVAAVFLIGGAVAGIRDHGRLAGELAKPDTREADHEARLQAARKADKRARSLTDPLIARAQALDKEAIALRDALSEALKREPIDRETITTLRARYAQIQSAQAQLMADIDAAERLP